MIGLLVVAVSAVIVVDRASDGGATAAPTRDPWLRPFTSTSIWNMPIGTGAQYSHANFGYTKHHARETSYLVKTDPSDPVLPVYNMGHWRDRCTGTKDTGLRLHVPDDLQPKPASGQITPNNPAVFLQPDGRTLVNLGALARCGGKLHADRPGSTITDLYGDGIEGAHGASYLSQLGGAIRPGDMIGDEPIRHALNILVWADYLYWGGTKESSYRWPARSSDAYAGPERYRGNDPQLRMGSLLALPPNLQPADLGISTREGRKIFEALRDYGAYITDDAAWDATYIGVDEQALDEFPWGTAQQDDMAKMVQSLHVVTNNGPNSTGGGGTPRRPLLPELDGSTPVTNPSSPGGSTANPPTGPSGRTEDPLERADRLGEFFVIAPDVPGRVAFADSFNADDARLLDQRSNPRWAVFNGTFEARDGAAVVTAANGAAMALASAGSADVSVKSTITLSNGRAAPGLAVRATDENNGIIASMVLRDGHDRISLHAVHQGEYTLLAEVRAVGLRRGQTYELELVADGSRVSVELDGVSVLSHELSSDLAGRYGSNTSHGLRIMRNSTADDGGSRWNDVVVTVR
ncbi:MAG: hypothetical protein AAF945_07515 [Actinomycetota bacterium]